jgi:hypothetical protein
MRWVGSWKKPHTEDQKPRSSRNAVHLSSLLGHACLVASELQGGRSDVDLRSCRKNLVTVRMAVTCHSYRDRHSLLGPYLLSRVAGIRIKIHERISGFLHAIRPSDIVMKS